MEMRSDASVLRTHAAKTADFIRPDCKTDSGARNLTDLENLTSRVLIKKMGEN